MLINLTPHPVSIYARTEVRANPARAGFYEPINGAVPTVTLQPAQDVPARCDMVCLPDGVADGVPLYATSYGEVSDLPAPKAGVWYIVSALVAQACPDRHDLLIPHQMVRDEFGRILGCAAFARPKV